MSKTNSKSDDARIRLKEQDSRTIDRHNSRRFSQKENFRQYAHLLNQELPSDESDKKESVFAIWPARRRDFNKNSAVTSELGLVPSQTSPLVSSRASCDASFAISLNEVREKTNMLNSGNSSGDVKRKSAGQDVDFEELIRAALRPTLRQSKAKNRSKLSGGVTKDEVLRKVREAGTVASSAFDKSANLLDTRCTPKSPNLVQKEYSGRVKTKESSVPQQRVYYGHAAMVETLRPANYCRVSSGNDGPNEVKSSKSASGKSSGHASASVKSGDRSTKSEKQVDQTAALAGAKGAVVDGVRSLEEKGSLRDIELVRTPSGDSGDDDYEPEGEEGGDDAYTGPELEVKFEDMLYLWDLNRDVKNLVHSRIRDLGLPKFLGMGVTDKGNVAPDIVMTDAGPISAVEAELRARIERPSFMEKRWL